MTLVVAWLSISIARWWICSFLGDLFVRGYWRHPFDDEQYVVQELEGLLLVRPALSSSFHSLLEAGIEPRRVSDFCFQRGRFPDYKLVRLGSGGKIKLTT